MQTFFVFFTQKKLVAKALVLLFKFLPFEVCLVTPRISQFLIMGQCDLPLHQDKDCYDNWSCYQDHFELTKSCVLKWIWLPTKYRAEKVCECIANSSIDGFSNRIVDCLIKCVVKRLNNCLIDRLIECNLCLIHVYYIFYIFNK